MKKMHQDACGGARKVTKYSEWDMRSSNGSQVSLPDFDPLQVQFTHTNYVIWVCFNRTETQVLSQIRISFLAQIRDCVHVNQAVLSKQTRQDWDQECVMKATKATHYTKSDFSPEAIIKVLLLSASDL